MFYVTTEGYKQEELGEQSSDYRNCPSTDNSDVTVMVKLLCDLWGDCSLCEKQNQTGKTRISQSLINQETEKKHKKN